MMHTKNVLPSYFKAVGFIIVAAAFVTPIIMGMIEQKPWVATQGRRSSAQAVIIFGLLLVVLAREAVEDEFIASCRLLAFRIALIAGIVYYLQDVFGTFSGNLLHSSFGLLVMQLSLYWLVFFCLKQDLFSNGK